MPKKRKAKRALRKAKKVDVEQPVESTLTEKKTKLFHDHVDKVKAIAKDKKIRGTSLVLGVVNEEKAKVKDAHNA